MTQPSTRQPSTSGSQATSPDGDVAGWAHFPGAVAPERTRFVNAWGVGIRVVEWGKPSDPILLLAHGGADFAQTFDVFAPLLAAGGYRVVSWDQRCHGDSEAATLHSWEADCRDAVAVLESAVEDRATGEKAFAVGHSKGGGLMTDLCVAMPERFHCLVNIDGVPARGGRWSESGKRSSTEERVKKRHRWLTSFLEHRAKASALLRRPGTPDELVDRRARLNPRLSREWLQYLVTVGARHAEDGWRWKLDPLMRMGNPGPWKPEWNTISIGAVRLPMLAILGSHPEMMGWGAPPEESAKTLPEQAEFEVFEDSGHFVHIEHPARTARRVLSFLQQHHEARGSAARPSTSSSSLGAESIDTENDSPATRAADSTSDAEAPAVMLRHGRIDLALHHLKTARNPTVPPLLCLHELGGNTHAFSSNEAQSWPGDVWGLDLAGHGESAWAPGGGYAPEWLLGDVDTAIRHLTSSHHTEPPKTLPPGTQPESTVALLGSGLGAYLSLMAIGSRPNRVVGAILKDGQGLAGGGAQPVPRTGIAGISVPNPVSARSDASEATDPLAVADLTADVRPPSYTATFVRQVEHLGPNSTDGLPIWNTVPAERQPPWLTEIAHQLRASSIETALDQCCVVATMSE